MGQHAFKILEYVFGSDPKRLKPEIGENRISDLIPTGPVAPVMPFAVDFDCEATVEACEVHNIPIDWILAPKSESIWTLAQLLPENDLGQTHVSAKSASKTDVFVRSTDRPMTYSR